MLSTAWKIKRAKGNIKLYAKGGKSFDIAGSSDKIDKEYLLSRTVVHM